MSKERILHISKYYYPFKGGLEQMARVCVQALSDRAEQCVLCYDHQSNKQDSVDEVDGVNVYRCATQITAASQPLSRTYGHVLEERIRRFRPDVVFFIIRILMRRHFS